MKLAPVYEALKHYPGIHQCIIHTGQHFHQNMSDIFFEEFSIPQPDINLAINERSPLQQIAEGILQLEKILPTLHPQLVIIYGDINATAYTSIVCSKLSIKLAHVEAGLRSFDRSMPEETNRIIADALSDYYFTPSADAGENLVAEGVNKENIFFTGNVMIDTLVKFLPKSQQSVLNFEVPANYALVTLHRPSNVDDTDNFIKILKCLETISQQYQLIFPLHPRTKKSLPTHFITACSNMLFTEPLGYLQFLKLQKNAAFVITDSGGIQEESTYLGVPCFTLRNNTERPVTVQLGTNILVGTHIENLKNEVNKFLNGKRKRASIPPLWDGKAAQRIAGIVNGLMMQNDEVVK